MGVVECGAGSWSGALGDRKAIECECVGAGMCEESGDGSVEV